MVNYLYIHIPFCIKKCIYCDFYSVPFRSKIAEDYIKALCKEIELRKNELDNLTTVYIGGGTPTILSTAEISKILDAVRSNCRIRSDAEITIEANPRTITEKKAEILLKSGINRISVGVQSFVDDELTILSRSHNAQEAINAVKGIKRAGFKNISLDLIYGIPFLISHRSGVRSKELQIKNWEYSLQKAIEISPEHISTYELTPERDTPLYKEISEGRLVMHDEGVIAEMYYKVIDILSDNGYVHYEISNFAKPGYECKHNMNYWNRGEYIGIGAGAHSFFGRNRTSNVRDIGLYIEGIERNSVPVAEDHYITDEEAEKEFMFLGMRKTEGINMELLLDRDRELIQKAVKDLESHGLVEVNGSILRLTRKGLILSNEVIVKLML